MQDQAIGYLGSRFEGKERERERAKVAADLQTRVLMRAREFASHFQFTSFEYSSS